MFKTKLRVLLILVIGLIVGVLGLLVGMYIGGNYAEQFMFNGVRGYEATGQVGFIFGALIGLASSWWILFKRKK